MSDRLDLERGGIKVLEGKDHRPVTVLAVDVVGLTGRKALMMDGSHTIDPYFMVRKAKEKDLDERKVLKKVFISRAFTSYQFVDLVEKAERMIENEDINFLGVVALTPLFEDDEMDEIECRWLRSKVIRDIKGLVQENEIYGVVVDPKTNIFERHIDTDERYGKRSNDKSR